MIELRLSSEAPFPYGYPGWVCYIEQTDEELQQLSSREEARAAVKRALAGQSRILAVWPGEHRAGLFLIDDLPALARAIKADHVLVSGRLVPRDQAPEWAIRAAEARDGR